MSIDAFIEPCNAWIKSGPQLTGLWYEDQQLLHSYCLAGETLLADLPVKPQRSDEQQQLANRLFVAMRQVRSQFCRHHINAIAALLFADQATYVSLTQMARKVSAIVPGLVPNETQMGQENARAQIDKEGLEVDEGIFFNALLNQADYGQQLIELMRRPTDLARQRLAEFEQHGQIDFGKVTVEIKAGAGHISFVNPECLNAEDNQLIAQLEVAVDLVLLSNKVDVGVLRGAVVSHPRYKNRRVFSAGINLKHIKAGLISYTDFIMARELGYINKMICGLAVAGGNLEKPWVAAVDTFAIGGGMQLLFGCDYVLGAQDSYASLPAAKEGIVPGVSNLRLPTAASGRLAQQVILHGHKIYASAPDAQWVFDQVVPAEQMDETLAQAISLMQAPAVVANRAMLRRSLHNPEAFRLYMADFALAQVERLYAIDVMNKVHNFGSARSAI